MASFLEFYRSRAVLSEGGAAGHIFHPFENRNMKFGELKNIIEDLFSGKVDLSEKTDGLNISVTWKDGNIGLARNKATIKEPLSISKTALKFEGRGPIKRAFVNSMEDMERALRKIDKDTLEKWFGNGNKFLSVEVIYPPAKNVIDYGDRCILHLHGLQTYDDKQNKTGEDEESAREIYRHLQSADALKQKTFTIVGPQALKINDIRASEKNGKKFIEDIESLQDKYEIPDGDTIGKYLKKRWEIRIKTEFPDISNSLAKVLSEDLSSGKNPFDSPSTIKAITKSGVSEEHALSFSEKVDDIGRKFIFDIEKIVIAAGAKLLSGLSGFISANPKESVKKLSMEIDSAIDSLESELESGLVPPEKIKKLSVVLKKLDEIGMGNLSPIEGVVFKYNGKTYKMTGKFGTINKLIGLIKHD